MNQPPSSPSESPDDAVNQTSEASVPTPPEEQLSRNAVGGKVADHFVSAADKLDQRDLGKVTMMADGTMRTANHAIVEPNSWKNKQTWYAKLYRSLHRKYLRITLRWPSWVPRAVGVGIAVVIAANIIVLAAYTSQKRLVEQRGDALPTLGTIPADGSKYYVASAGWQYGGNQIGWAIQDITNKDGKEYVSSDGACNVQVVEKATQSDGITLESVKSLTMDAYANPIGQARAQVALPAITIDAAQGEQKFEFVRSRYVFNQNGSNRVVEIASRTLGKESFSIIQQCNQADWDQSQSARDQLLDNLAINAS